MKYEIKNLPDSQKEIWVLLEFDELKPYFEKVAQEKEIQIKGFRKGKIPKNLMDLFLDQDLLEETAKKTIQEIYLKIIKENDLEVLGMPKVQIIKLAPSSPFEFKIKIDVLPKIDLPDYKKIASQVKRRKVSVRDEEIEQTIKWIQKSRAKKYPKDENSQIGDYVEFSWSSSQIEDGKEYKEGIILGESYLLPEFEREIIGTRAGQKKEFEVNFPQNYFNQALAGKRVKITAFIHKVERIELPEINDEWAKSLGRFKNLEELRESIKEGIWQEKEQIESQRIQDEILRKISQQTLFEIPKILFDMELQRTLEEIKENIPQLLGISFDEYLKRLNQNEEEFKKSISDEVKEKVKKFLILREIKKREGIQATEEEIKNEADRFLARFSSVKEAQETIDPESLREYIKERIENQKTLQWLENFAQKEV